MLIQSLHQNSVSLVIELLSATSTADIHPLQSISLTDSPAVSYQSFRETSPHPCYFTISPSSRRLTAAHGAALKVRWAAARAESRSPTHLKFG